MLSESIVLKIQHIQRLKSDTLLGDCEIKINKLLTGSSTQNIIKFCEPITRQGTTIGQVSSIIIYLTGLVGRYNCVTKYP